MNCIKKLIPYCLLTLSTLSTTVLADWNIDSEQSRVFFISTKNINVSEVLKFNHIEGQLSNDGKFTADIVLSSVESGIDIRNQRMRDMLFNVSTFPKANISATLSATIMALENGQSLHTQIPATLGLLGKNITLNLDIIVNKTNNGQYIVASGQPLLVSASDLGLQEGVEALQKIAGLSSIGLTVPVTFNLVLN